MFGRKVGEGYEKERMKEKKHHLSLLRRNSSIKGWQFCVRRRFVS